MELSEEILYMNKGLSYIVASIIMLIITISLAGAAWLYMSGHLTGTTVQLIDVLDFTYGDIRIRNLDTSPITENSINVYVDHQEVPFKISNTKIEAGAIGKITILNSYDYNGQKNVKIRRISFMGDFGNNGPEGQSTWLYAMGKSS